MYYHDYPLSIRAQVRLIRLALYGENLLRTLTGEPLAELAPYFDVVNKVNGKVMHLPTDPAMEEHVIFTLERLAKQAEEMYGKGTY